jgi:hypothetical protein
MKIQSKFLGVAIASVATLGMTAPSYAIEVIGNLPTNNDDQESVLNGTQQKALSFTVEPGFNWSLDSVTLRLGGFDSGDADRTSPVSGGDQTFYNVSLRTDNGGSPSSSSLLLFTNPRDPSNNAPSTGALRNWTFTPTSSYTLASEQKYWIVVSGNAFSWKAADPDEPPTSSQDFTTDGYQIAGFNNSSWAGSSLSNAITVNASNPTAVPFDFSATPGLFLVGGLWGANQLRRRGSKAKLLED